MRNMLNIDKTYVFKLFSYFFIDLSMWAKKVRTYSDTLSLLTGPTAGWLPEPSAARKWKKSGSVGTFGGRLLLRWIFKGASHIENNTLQGINISHLEKRNGKRKIIFKMPYFGGYVSSLEGILANLWWFLIPLAPSNLLRVLTLKVKTLAGDLSLAMFCHDIVSDCWWKESCTSWYGKYPIIYRVLYIPGGAGLLLSKVCTVYLLWIYHANHLVSITIVLKYLDMVLMSYPENSMCSI